MKVLKKRKVGQSKPNGSVSKEAMTTTHITLLKATCCEKLSREQPFLIEGLPLCLIAINTARQAKHQRIF